MKLVCPSNPEHKIFVLTAMVPETWILNEDGDCEHICEANGCAIDSDLATARCEECDALAALKEE
jgi:hypothetical protein